MNKKNTLVNFSSVTTKTKTDSMSITDFTYKVNKGKVIGIVSPKPDSIQRYYELIHGRLPIMAGEQSFFDYHSQLKTSPTKHFLSLKNSIIEISDIKLDNFITVNESLIKTLNSSNFYINHKKQILDPIKSKLDKATKNLDKHLNNLEFLSDQYLNEASQKSSALMNGILNKDSLAKEQHDISNKIYDNLKKIKCSRDVITTRKHQIKDSTKQIKREAWFKTTTLYGDQNKYAAIFASFESSQEYEVQLLEKLTNPGLLFEDKYIQASKDLRKLKIAIIDVIKTMRVRSPEMTAIRNAKSVNSKTLASITLDIKRHKKFISKLMKRLKEVDPIVFFEKTGVPTVEDYLSHLNFQIRIIEQTIDHKSKRNTFTFENFNKSIRHAIDYEVNRLNTELKELQAWRAATLQTERKPWMKGPYYDALVIANEKHYAYLASALSGLSVVYNQAAVEIIKTFSFTTEFESKYIFGLVKEYVKYFYKIEVSLINYRTKNKVQRKNLQLKAEVYYEKNKIVAFKKEIKSLEKLIDYKTYRANQEKLFIENESEINSFFISANKKIINLQDMRVSQKQIDLTDHLVDAKKNLEKLLESETLRLENRPAIIDEKIERVVRRLAFNKAHLNNTINEFTENQKIQIATLHAIILDPRIITFNSPHLMIDSYVVPQLLSTFQKVAKVFNITFIFSIKNSNLMFKLSDEILIVEDNKLLEFGTPKKIIKNPVRRETISLLKSVMTNYNETLQVCDRVVREHISEFASLETKEIKRDHHALIKHTPGERK